MTEKNKTYSQAMKRLDEILEDIDASDVPVDELADKVVEAAGLLKACRKLLSDTEAKVTEVLEDLNAEFQEPDLAVDEE
jgi:exodeoxyribonuclease VII small subunit